MLTRLERQLERIAAVLERWVDGVDGAGTGAERGTPLPEGLPGREALHEAGVVYLEALPRSGEALAALGLDGRMVNRVLTWLKSEA